MAKKKRYFLYNNIYNSKIIIITLMFNNCCLDQCKGTAHSKCIDCQESFCVPHSRNHLNCNKDHFIEQLLMEITSGEELMIRDFILKQESLLFNSITYWKSEFTKIIDKLNRKLALFSTESNSILHQIAEDKLTLNKSLTVSSRLYQNYLSKSLINCNIILNPIEKIINDPEYSFFESIPLESIDTKNFTTTDESNTETFDTSIAYNSQDSDFNSSLIGIQEKDSDFNSSIAGIQEKEPILDYESYFMNVSSYNVNEFKNISIYYYRCQLPDDDRFIKKKEFIFNKTKCSLDLIDKEINILEKLSNIRQPSNLFYKLYHINKTEEKITVFSETFQTRLIDCLKDYIKRKCTFSPEIIIKWISSIISSFYEMNNLNIKITTVTLENFLITTDGNIKIADINCFNNEEKHSKFNMFKIINKTQFFVSKSEIEDYESNTLYSLAIIIFQIINLDNALGYNLKCNKSKFKTMIESKIKEQWIKELLINMISSDTTEKCTFSKCYKVIQSHKNDLN